MAFLASRGLFKFNLKISYGKFQPSRFKRAFLLNYYSCWTYTNNQAKFIEITYFANKLDLTWLSLGKIMILEEKITCQ